MSLAIAVIFALVVLFVLSRIVASAMGSRKRAAYVTSRLMPVIEALQANKVPEIKIISGIAAFPELRMDLYQLLRYHGKTDLFPREFLNVKSAGEAAMAYWLLHPNEYGSVPPALRFVREVNVLYNGKDITYAVFRFHDDRSKRDEAGVAGPFFPGRELYLGYPGTFSTFEPYDAKTPEEHVFWVHKTMTDRHMYGNME